MDRSLHCDPQRIKALAFDQAKRLGASDVRVTDATAHGPAQASMHAAFRRGDFETWGYDDAYAAKAATPEHLLPGAQSVICIAVPYRTEDPQPRRLEGRISNYAWSADYHHRLKALLRTIAQRIDEAAGASVTAIACDTKPLAERAFAARAGLGWIGKHTNLITPQAGSFVFLGEIVTTLRLPPDEPLRKTCGSCTRCLPACPTGALRGNYTIDATRCISDLTQRTDGIPLELRPFIGTWVWGCDLCQIACPPNERAVVQGGPENRATSPETATPDLVKLLQLRSGEFKRTYRATAIGWRGAAVLRRNAAVALGNALDRSTVPALSRALSSDPHAQVRGHAAWALGRIASPPAIFALNSRLAVEHDESVRFEISHALEPLVPA
ncbi:MAG TPA: tRNA epoxyqueuosine(34) reductase QueG [Candidatus Baltobacteraceae bacterium]|jgi:epoxyqueuosine reductase|nr:tRNA epoxyqueuosine(34) reductase QueG [Candidatus Baltobacteraceae bacterium]